MERFGSRVATLPRTASKSNLYVSNHCRTKEYLRSLKMNDECRALKFSKSGSQLFTHGEGGEVYIWDVRYLKILSAYFSVE
jgi:hypothetical protein